MAITSAGTSGQLPVTQLLTRGFAYLWLDTRQRATLDSLYRLGAQFFAQPIERKLRYACQDHSTGYRPHRYAYAGSPDKPDLNDSFLHWNSNREGAPDASEISDFVTALEAWRIESLCIVTRLVSELSRHYRYTGPLGLDDASYVQVNSYAEPSQEELSQHPHEDSVFVTVISTSAPGLERVRGEVAEPIVIADDEVLLMPGSIMTDMTGGEIEPLYHRVRNHRLRDRSSVTFFASPEIHVPIIPFRITEQNRDVDIRQRVIDNPQQFGLSADFIR